MKRARLIGRLRRTARLLRSVRPVRIEDGVGADLRMDLRRASAWYGRGTNELPIQEALAAELRTGDTFFDIGANVGFFTLIGARLVGPGGRAVAFEPVAGNAAAIRRNAAMNRLINVSVVEAAVAAEDGREDLFVTAHPGGAVLASVGAPPDPHRVVTVPAVCIDGMVERGEVPAPAVVKIDVEGAETAVLRGMERTARRLHPTLICEVDDATPERLTPRRAEIEGMLASWGYSVRELAPAYPSKGWTVVHLLATPAAEGNGDIGAVR